MVESDEDFWKHGLPKDTVSMNSDNKKQSIDFLKKVDGLEYETALDRMAGSFDNYMKVLAVSVGNINDNYNALVSLSELTNMAKAANHLHSLKGIFLNIGADSLAEQSKQLELAMKTFDTAYVKGHMCEYMEQIKVFSGKLSEACGEYRKQYEVSDGSRMDNEEFNRSIEKMRSLIEDYEYTEIMDLLEKIMPRCDGEKKQYIGKICDCIQSFEYEEALSVLDRML